MLGLIKKNFWLLILPITMAACVTTKPTENAAASAAAAETTINEANAAYKAGQPEKAISLFKNAAGLSPTDKTPWIRMAQIKFDSGNYSGTISDATEALQRDPSDKIANSLVAVSGLRLSTKALEDLRKQNELSGTVRSEAQDLAKLLRESIGETVLIPPANKPVATNQAANSRSATRRPTSGKAPQHAVSESKPSPAPDKESGGANPFSALK